MACEFLEKFFNGVPNDTSILEITHRSLTPGRIAVLSSSFSGSLPSSSSSSSSSRPSSSLPSSSMRLTSPLSLKRMSRRGDVLLPSAEQEEEMEGEEEGEGGGGEEEEQTRTDENPPLTPAATTSARPQVKKMGLEEEIIYRFVQHLISQDIHLVCFDFDRTIVDPRFTQEFIHPLNIYNRLSPLFIKLGKMLLENGFNITIVTFNINPNIEPAISGAFRTPINVFARDDHLAETGKSFHLDSAIKAYNSRMQIDDKNGLRPQNVLFFDDDDNNTEIATRSGYNCINNPNVICLDDLVRYIEETEH